MDVVQQGAVWGECHHVRQMVSEVVHHEQVTDRLPQSQTDHFDSYVWQPGLDVSKQLALCRDVYAGQGLLSKDCLVVTIVVMVDILSQNVCDLVQ
jgi:hypothetical protein